MKLEDQVCSLELAKRLKELGVKQDSVLYHGANGQITGNLLDLRSPTYSAFTVAELGELIGDRCISFRTVKTWFTGHVYPEGTRLYTPGQKTEANSRASFLAFIIENKLIKPTENG